MADHKHWFAVSSPTGVNVGLWDDGKIAADVVAGFPDRTMMELVEVSEVATLTARITELEAEVERQTTLREMHQRYQKDAEADRDKAVAVADKKALRVSALGTENARLREAVKLLRNIITDYDPSPDADIERIANYHTSLNNAAHFLANLDKEEAFAATLNKETQNEKVNR